ncbi:MAG: hypothetical protein ACW98K_13465, partial [Candidatus Kariarchaeaceae archaeon]
MQEIVAFRTTIPDAKARLSEFKDAFKNIPYIWSYFRVIDILDNQLEAYITELESNPESSPIQRLMSYPDEPRSQVIIKEHQQVEVDQTELLEDSDNPFAELENFGEQVSSEDFDTTFGDEDLLKELAAATELEKLTTEDFDEELQEDEAIGFLPIVVQFDKIVSTGRGDKIGNVPILMERLLHHARREGRMTRIMQDYLQDIFREAFVGWRITGLLAEDFVQGDPSQLASIMIGVPSPYVIIRETFDLEYWTTGTLQSGDERLMYT